MNFRFPEKLAVQSWKQTLENAEGGFKMKPYKKVNKKRSASVMVSRQMGRDIAPNKPSAQSGMLAGTESP